MLATSDANMKVSSKPQHMSSGHRFIIGNLAAIGGTFSIAEGAVSLSSSNVTTHFDAHLLHQLQSYLTKN